MRNTKLHYLFYKLVNFFGSISTKKSIVIITTVGLLVYGNALFNGYVGDDTRFIFENQDIRHFSIKYLFGPNLFNAGSYYRPIPAVYFSLLYNLFGIHYFFYHFVQVVLHTINTFLLFLLFRCVFTTQAGANQTSRNRNTNIDLLALFLSLIFLVHPINVESVAYTASAQDTLYFLFGIAALLMVFKEKGRRNLLIAFSLLLLSILTKETGILFFLMALCVQFIFKRNNYFKLIIFQAIALGIYFYIRFAVGKVFFTKFIGPYAMPPIQDLSLIERVIHIPKIILTYLITTLFPLRLAIFQQWVITKTDLQNVYMPLVSVSIFLLLLFGSGIYVYKYRKDYFNILLFFLLWFILGLSMVLQIFPLDMTVADRWFYFPLVGILGIIGVGINTFLFAEDKSGNSAFKYKKGIVPVALVGASIILLLSVRTVIRNTNYRDDITQQSHDTQIQENYLLETYLGINYRLRGSDALAIKHLEKSVSIRPISFNLFTLGFLYESTGDLGRAKENYHQAIIAADSYYSENKYRFPNDVKVYIRYALVLLENKEYAKAFEIAGRGLQYYPKSSILWVTLATIYYAQENYQGAESSLKKAKQITSNDLLHQIDFLMVNRQTIPLSLISEYAEKAFMREINSEQ